MFSNEELHNLKYFEIKLRLSNQGVRQIVHFERNGHER
jgi:hypothetical protein